MRELAILTSVYRGPDGGAMKLFGKGVRDPWFCLPVLFCMLLAHSYGAATWCHVALPDGVYWYALLGVLLAEATLYALSRHLSAARAGGERND
jgi:hypothetical protein